MAYHCFPQLLMYKLFKFQNFLGLEKSLFKGFSAPCNHRKYNSLDHTIYCKYYQITSRHCPSNRWWM